MKFHSYYVFSKYMRKTANVLTKKTLLQIPSQPTLPPPTPPIPPHAPLPWIIITPTTPPIHQTNQHGDEVAVRFLTFQTMEVRQQQHHKDYHLLSCGRHHHNQHHSTHQLQQHEFLHQHHNQKQKQKRRHKQMKI
jgi:hypothetical protein